MAMASLYIFFNFIQLFVHQLRLQHYGQGDST